MIHQILIVSSFIFRQDACYSCLVFHDRHYNVLQVEEGKTCFVIVSMNPAILLFREINSLLSHYLFSNVMIPYQISSIKLQDTHIDLHFIIFSVVEYAFTVVWFINGNQGGRLIILLF